MVFLHFGVSQPFIKSYHILSFVPHHICFFFFISFFVGYWNRQLIWWIVDFFFLSSGFPPPHFYPRAMFACNWSTENIISLGDWCKCVVVNQWATSLILFHDPFMWRCKTCVIACRLVGKEEESIPGLTKWTGTLKLHGEGGGGAKRFIDLNSFSYQR
jgi:hypothetical protein